MALVPGVMAHAGTVGLILELAAAFGLVALGLAAWLGTRKERQ